MPQNHGDYRVTLGKDLGKKAEKLARKRSLSVTTVVKIALSEWLARQEK